MKTITNSNCTSTTTITNTPKIVYSIGRKYKDHTIVYKIVNGKKIRLKCIKNTNPLYLKKHQKNTRAVINISSEPKQLPAA